MKDGVRMLQMGVWMRKILPHYTDVDAKLRTMDAAGIAMTALSINDPGPEWFGPDGPAVAQMANDIVSPLPLAMKFGYDFMGPDRLLYSSDHPWVEPQLIADALTSLKLPAADEARIFGGNARTLFGLTGGI